MPIQRVHQNSFTRGEVDETFIGRTDLAPFKQALKKARNCFSINQGPIERRAGTMYRADLGAESRLEPFIFNTEQEYIFAFQHTKLLIYNTSGTLLQTVTSMVWQTAELYELNVTQQADTMIVTHKDFAPQVVTRTGATTFVVTPFAFATATNAEKTYQPYYKFAEDTITLDINNTVKGSTVTCTTSAAYWTSDYVGKRIRYHGTEILITGYTSSTVVTGTLQARVRIELDEDPLKGEEGEGTITVLHPKHGFVTGASITVEGAESIYNDDGNGLDQGNINITATITVLDDDRYTYTADNSDTASDSADGGGTNVRIIGHPPTRQWDEEVYNVINGFPQACRFHQQRLWFAGGAISDFIASSKTSEYYNFDVGDAEDTDSIQINISSDQINQIVHLVSGKHLEIFTTTGEFYLKPAAGKPIIPTDLQILKQRALGSQTKCMPRVFDGAAIFIQPNGKTVREYFYNSAAEEYTPMALSLLSPHAVSNPQDSGIIKKSGIRTEMYIAFANDNGKIGIFTANRQEKLAGWLIWETDGEYQSVAGTTGFLYTAVKRTINSSTKYYLEQFASSAWDVPTDCTQSKIISGSYQPHGTPLINGSHSSAFHILVDGFSNAPSAGETFKISSTEYVIQSVTATGNTGEYILTVPTAISASDNTAIEFVTSKVFTGLTHLAAKEVHATSGSTEDAQLGYYGKGTVTAGGVVTFDQPAAACDIGLDYTVDIETLPLDAANAIRGLGSTYGLPRKIGKTVLELSKTYNLQVNGNDVLLNDDGLTMVGYTGKKDVHTLGYSQTPFVSITQTIPIPFRIVSITSEVYF